MLLLLMTPNLLLLVLSMIILMNYKGMIDVCSTAKGSATKIYLDTTALSTTVQKCCGEVEAVQVSIPRSNYTC